MSDTPDAVVIGSGFGGAISALRLAEAGRSVVVLERGKRYRPGDFPRDTTRDRDVLWRYRADRSSRGLYDVRFMSGIAAVVASGVGGGSLVYANIHIRPDSIIFEDPRWPRAFTRAALDPYYDRVAKMLGVQPMPPGEKSAKREAFRRAAQAGGHPIFDPDQAVSWEQPHSAGQQVCQRCAECEFGCQQGAKNTLDFNYLREAERRGAEIRPNSLVSDLEPVAGGYRVHFIDTTTGERKSLTARRVVLAAGTLGTNEILLRSRDVTRRLPQLSQRLGLGYSGNGDFLGSLQNSATDLDPWHGTDVTSVIRYFEAAPQFTMAAPSFNEATMRVLASLGQPSLGAFRWLSPLVWPLMNFLLPYVFRFGLLSRPSRFPAKNAGPPERMTNLFAIGRDNANGLISWRGKSIDIQWDYLAENRQLVEKMERAMNEVAATYGGTAAPIATWNLFRRIITVHSLGGCHLSESPATGVVSTRGEVHGYPGLFIADGSVIPTAIGFHPVMTISAVAEWIAEAVVESFARPAN